MKVKIDFVTNSSSSCFLISIPKDSVDDLTSSIGRMNNDPDACNNGVQFYMDPTESLKDLQEHTNDGPLDWVSLPGGPQFWNMNEESYKAAKQALEEGNAVAEISVDYNMCERFDALWGKSVLKVTS